MSYTDQKLQEALDLLRAFVENHDATAALPARSENGDFMDEPAFMAAIEELRIERRELYGEARTFLETFPRQNA